MEIYHCGICGEELGHPVWEEIFGSLYYCSKGHETSIHWGNEIPSIGDSPELHAEYEKWKMNQQGKQP
jgi:hypothetical protein